MRPRRPGGVDANNLWEDGSVTGGWGGGYRLIQTGYQYIYCRQTQLIYLILETLLLEL